MSDNQFDRDAYALELLRFLANGGRFDGDQMGPDHTLDQISVAEDQIELGYMRGKPLRDSSGATINIGGPGITAHGRKFLNEEMRKFETKAAGNDNSSSNMKPRQENGQLQMSPEESRNAGLNLLMLLAQTYYKMLESTIAISSWFSVLDLELNQSYLWTVEGITNLLKNHEGLKDFPVQFEPLFPDLYPSTIRATDWEDMVAPDAEQFLSSVQRYVHSKRMYDPEEGSQGWIFVQLFRPSIDLALERSDRYYKKMESHRKQTFGTPPKNNTELTREAGGKRFKIALSFPGEYRSFIERVAAHLAEKIGQAAVLYDKYHESELARVDLDTYLQKLYHDESELIAVFLCSDYARKEWCGLEWRSLRDLIKKSRGSAIMPFRFDNTDIQGLFSIDGYVEIGSRTPLEIANCILERMHLNRKA
jgi:TIR domain